MKEIKGTKGDNKTRRGNCSFCLGQLRTCVLWGHERNLVILYSSMSCLTTYFLQTRQSSIKSTLNFYFLIYISYAQPKPNLSGKREKEEEKKPYFPMGALPFHSKVILLHENLSPKQLFSPSKDPKLPVFLLHDGW